MEGADVVGAVVGEDVKFAIVGAAVEGELVEGLEVGAAVFEGAAVEGETVEGAAVEGAAVLEGATVLEGEEVVGACVVGAIVVGDRVMLVGTVGASEPPHTLEGTSNCTLYKQAGSSVIFVILATWAVSRQVYVVIACRAALGSPHKSPLLKSERTPLGTACHKVELSHIPRLDFGGN